MDCPLSWYFARSHSDRLQSSALTFGTLMHEAVLYMELTQDLEGAVGKWLKEWARPESVDVDLKIDEWIKGHSYAKLRDEGEKILRTWWELARWDTDVVLAREHHFVVPIGPHELEGTLDKLVIRWIDGDYHLLVVDYKTSRKRPKYDYLLHDIQFSAYCYATSQRAFWDGIGGTPEQDQALFDRWGDSRTFGEWVHLQQTKRLPAGERTNVHFNRLRYAVQEVARSISLEIYPPTISGETCAYCDHRVACGLGPEYRT